LTFTSKQLHVKGRLADSDDTKSNVLLDLLDPEHNEAAISIVKGCNILHSFGHLQCIFQIAFSLKI